MDPSEKKRPRKDDGDNNLTGDNGRLRCDCCCNPIILSDENHIQNNPCGHIVCLLCVVKSNMKRGANPTYFCCQCQVTNCSQNFTTSCQYFNRGVPGEIIISVVELSKDVIPSILSFLPLKEIMPKRRVSKKWNEAVKNTIIPPTDFSVDSVEKFNAMNVMTRALPNLQQITLGNLGYDHKYNDGEDPDEHAARIANRPRHDIGIISNFSKLRILKIHFRFCAGLNGRYPFLFNSFPLLQKLSIYSIEYLKFDLEMLAGFPLLKELDCRRNRGLTGDIKSLRVLKNTLERVQISNSSRVEGNIMDLADFPHLRAVELEHTAVTGDIRDIGENDFSSLEYLDLPHGVYGGNGYEFRRISDAPDVARAVYLFKKQRPQLDIIPETWYAKLSENSPDRYESADEDDDQPPFFICLVQAGSRFGYRWETGDSTPCEVNWLDPEPSRENSDYAKYIERLRQIDNEVTTYRGFYQPPTEEGYNRLWERNADENDE